MTPTRRRPSPMRPSRTARPGRTRSPRTTVDGASTSPGDTDSGTRRSGRGGGRTATACLALGDSITAAIGPQFGGQLCDVLEDQGWYVGVDAFQGRAIEAGLSVLRSDIDLDEWDAAIVNLGSNYRGDADGYAADLRAILTELAPLPVLVVTVTAVRGEHRRGQLRDP